MTDVPVKTYSMEELQSWWEVPSIAHFCYVFRAAFNLIHFQIEELEAALLPSDDSQLPCVTIEQLAMRLLKGCTKKIIANTENWEERLWKQFAKDPLKSVQHAALLKEERTFSSLDLREKVEVLLSLCELRLMSYNALKEIKHIESDDLRLEPIGTDQEGNAYWYFFGVRLYKEDLKLQEKLSKKSKPAGRGKSKTANGLNGTVGSRRKSSTLKQSDSNIWSIVCHTLEDWDKLSASLRKIPKNRPLSKLIDTKFIPMIQEDVAEREHLRQKQLLELAPRRTSSRIDQVKKQIQEKQQHIQAIAEAVKERRELEHLAQQEADKNRHIEDRAKRAKLREVRLLYGNETLSPSGSEQAQFFEDSVRSSTNYKESSSSEGSEMQTDSEEEKEEEEDSSESDTSYTPRAKVSKSEFYWTKPILENIPSVQSQKKTIPTHRKIGPKGGLQLNGAGIQASILYHSYKTYAIAPPTQIFPQNNTYVKKEPSETTSTPTVVTFDLLKENIKIEQ